jgi:protein SCO1/2
MMTRPHKVMIIVLWAAAAAAGASVLTMKAVLSARRPAPAGNASIDSPGSVLTPPSDDHGQFLPVLYNAPDFTLTDQDAKPFANSQLRGQPWVADFIFTQCASLCPMMSSRLSSLQDRIPAKVKFVSFSVDPKNDTPAALTDYAAKYHAQTGRWIFLTGPEKDEMQVVAGMKMYAKPAEGANPIEHSPYFVLVDAQGKVRGVYDSNTEQEIEQLVHDATLLAGDSGK